MCANAVADKLHDAVVGRRQETDALHELVTAGERKAAAHDA